jgi:site-specific DNA recombinase
MAQPAPATPLTLAAGGPPAPVTAEPVPVAFIGRTSTLTLQDPRASLRRQLRSAREWLPPGWFIAAVYWDIESGGIDLEARSQGDAYKQFTDAGLPRDGGMADLLREAAAPVSRFAAVICEDIERSGRDMFNALKLEKELSRQGIPLFATDEPADIEGVNATTVLVRRVKQGVAEWYRLQLKEKIWKGLIEHSLDGWNIGTPPYGYDADRIPHPTPFKAAQGRTKSRLIKDPDRAPVIKQIFTWRTVDKLGVPAIAARLNADPARYPAPSPATGWTQQNLAAMLANPKYTGHMVYGRHRTRNGHRTPVPPDQWLWSPEPVHPAIVDRDTWELAQTVAAGHGSSRDGDDLNAHPATLRFYPYRGRVRCRDCERRMAGNTYGKPASLSAYYRCPHNWGNPRHAAGHPDHPRTVQAPELTLDRITGAFFATRIFGPERAALLAAQIPATDAAAAADRDAQETAIKARIARIETAQNSKILELEDIPADPDNPAGQAYRARIRARFAELHNEREHLETQLKALAKTTPAAADTRLLDLLPLAGDVLPRLPPQLKARLFQTFDIAILWNKPGSQATVHAEITEHTLHAALAILDPTQDGHHDTDQHEPIGHLTNTPRVGRMSHPYVRFTLSGWAGQRQTASSPC